MYEKYSTDKTKNTSSDSGELLTFIDQIESNPDNKRIDPSEFIGLTTNYGGQKVVLFTEEVVKNDLLAVEQKLTQIKKSMAELSDSQREANITADFVETMIPQAIKELGWLGDQVKVIHPSLYDDFFRGIDMAIQILPDKEIVDERDMRCLGFSIDFTISRKEAETKFFNEMISIVLGRIPAMKYFATKFRTKEGEKEIKLKDFKIPRVIMTCTGQALEEAKEDFLKFEDDNKNQAVIERVSNNPLRFHFINETLSQLRFFTVLAEKVGNFRARDIYENSLRAFEVAVSEIGFDSNTVIEKTRNIPSLISKNFDLDANNGQMLEIVKTMATQASKK